MTKETRIKAELKRISVLFEDVADNQRAIVAPLLQNAAFMKVTLEDLQEIINREGVTDIYQNGANQKGTKQSATLQSYNSLIKNYANVTKTLAGLLPPERKGVFPNFPIKENQEEETDAEEYHSAEYWANQARQLRETGHYDGEPDPDPEEAAERQRITKVLEEAAEHQRQQRARERASK